MTSRVACNVVAVTDPFGVVVLEMIEPDDRGLWSDVEVFANLQRKTSGKPSFIAFLRPFSPSGSSLETLSRGAAKNGQSSHGFAPVAKIVSRLRGLVQLKLKGCPGWSFRH